MGSYDAFSDRQMLGQIVKEVKKGECSTYIAFSLSVAFVGFSLFVAESQFNELSFAVRYLWLIAFGFVFAILSWRERTKLDRN